MKLPKQIRSERLILKGITTPSFKLATKLCETVLCSKDTLMEWLQPLGKICVPEDEFPFLLDCQKNWKAGTEFHYLITEPPKKEILGVVGMFSVSDEKKSAEIGYWLSNEAVGYGYMQEAVHVLEDVAFQKGINRIVIRNDVKNLRSVHVAERCGYFLEGVMRQDKWDVYHKRWRNTNIFSKLKSDWEKQKKRRKS